MTYNIAVIGDNDSILPFKVVGFSIFPVKTSHQARQLLKQLEKENYGIIYITEQLAIDMMDVIEAYRKVVIPIVMLIPSYQGTHQLGMTNISENVEKAIGTNIL